MRVEQGTEWNFAYFLPLENEIDLVQLVVPAALQMDWAESPPFFMLQCKQRGTLW